LEEELEQELEQVRVLEEELEHQLDRRQPQKRRSAGPKTCTRIAELLQLQRAATRPACIVRHSWHSAVAHRSRSETSK